MDKKRNSEDLEAEVRRAKEMDFSFQQVNDYPLSDKTLVVSPQTIPLTTEEISKAEITDI